MTDHDPLGSTAKTIADKPAGDTPPPPPETAPGAPSSDTTGPVLQLRRSSGDRYVAGVAGGIGRQFDIDPLLVRVAFVVLTIAGAGAPLFYLAVWLFVPRDDRDRSRVAGWFGFGEREPRIRVVALAAAAVLSVLGFFDQTPGGDWVAWTALWILVAIGAVYALLRLFSPGRRSPASPDHSGPTPAGPATPSGPVGTPPLGYRTRPRSGSGALVLMTFALLAVGAGLTMAISFIAGVTVPVAGWAALATGVFGTGMLIGAWWGNGWWLFPFALISAVALAIGSLLPSAAIGERWVQPVSSFELKSAYTWGIGSQTIDLSGLSPARLAGRDITVRQGIGELVVIVPSGVAVDVTAHVGAGEVDVFDLSAEGFDQTLTTSSTPDLKTDQSGSPLTLDVETGLGDLEVVQR